ncbi:MAG: transcription elongation factor GreAB [Desulfuromonas sp.]|uniref:GreA/GreB family elongation factor n=1 Tax=Desulfuromonas sp. TaxID=892 RepID=UPI000CB3F434|nr:GreA/GreB family elongation factor [Desulfuromonas sp.]PLX86705.1 MAG: transcription elongation factor GreAB [Desulfuromonas sp.]
MNKERILQHIVKKLSGDLDLLLQAAKTAHQASTHEENVPDNKYATLALEASYIAQAQANRAQEIRCALEAYRKLPLLDFPDDAPIRLSALVTLEDGDGNRKTLFIGPQSGGLKVEKGGGEIVVITPDSPVGRELLGKEAGDVVEMRSGASKREWEIVEVR